MLKWMSGSLLIVCAFVVGVLAFLTACGGGTTVTPAAPVTAAAPSVVPSTNTPTVVSNLTATPPGVSPTSQPTAAPTRVSPTSQPTAARTSALQVTPSALNWQLVSTGTHAQLQSVSCPSVTLCLAAGGDNTLIKSVDGGMTWSAKQIKVPPSEITQVYCQSESKCLALFNDPVLMTGGVLETADGGETWTQTESWDPSRSAIDRSSCVGSGTCYGIVETGIVKRTGTDPHWHGTNGSVFPAPPPARYLVDIVCPSDQLCLAVGMPRVGDEGIILRITNGGADASRVTTLTSDLQGVDFDTITCQNAQTCLAAGLGGIIAQSQDAGASWTRLSWTPPSSQGVFGLKAMSCPSAQVCVAGGGNFLSGQCCGTIIRTVDGGKTWTNEKLDLPSLVESVSCISETECVAVGDNGLIVKMTAGAVASLPTATVAPPAGNLIANAVMAAGSKGFDMPVGLTDTFPPDWREIHTLVTTSQAPPGTRIRIVWTAVDIGSAGSPNTQIGEYSNTVEGSQNFDYYFTPSGSMAEGAYKVDLYVNDKLNRTLNFYVRASASTPVVNTTPSPVGSCPSVPSQPSQSAIVQSITMAKDTDGTTKAPVNPTSVFSPNDTFHAAIKVVSAPNNTKFTVIWFATDVGDAAPCNFQITDPTDLTTSGSTNLDFTLNRSQGFPVGLYRVEVFVNNKFAMRADFSVH